MASHSLGLSLHEAARSMGVPFTEENEPEDRTVRANGMNFHYLEWGDPANPTVVMLHGVSQQAHSWDFVSLALSPVYHVIALDQRGHGDSNWSKYGIYTLKAHLRDIGGFVRALDLKKIILVGLSMGGRNSIAYAGIHPERIDRLVIVDVGPEIMKKGIENIQRFVRRTDILPTREAFIERAHQFNPLRPIEQLRDRLSWHLRQLPDGQWTWKYDRRFRNRRSAEAGQEDLWSYVRRVKAPTLLVRGALSDILSPAAAKRLQKAIPGSSLVVIEKAGHTVAGDNPPAFAAAVRSFLHDTGR